LVAKSVIRNRCGLEQKDWNETTATLRTTLRTGSESTSGKEKNRSG